MKKIITLISIFSFFMAVPAYAALSLNSANTGINSIRSTTPTAEPPTVVAPSNLGVSPAEEITINPQPEPPKEVIGNADDIVELNPQPDPPMINEIEVEDASERVQLNPQPEPPIQNKTTDVKGAINNARQEVQLNPQPEPPAPISTAILNKVFEAGDKSELQPDVSVQLNPQPEPPLPIFNSAVDLTSVKTATIQMPIFSNPLSVNLVKEDDGIRLTSASGPDADSETMDLKILSEVKFAGSKTTLMSDNKDYELKVTPVIFYSKLKSALASQGVSQINEMKLKVEDGRPVYEFEYKEPVKLFGFIPFDATKRALVNEDATEVIEVKKPWYAFLATEPVNILEGIELKANLVMTNVRFEPAYFNKGDEVKVIGTVTNEGPVIAIAMPDFLNNTGPGAKLLVDGEMWQWYFVMFVLQPGESKDFDFTTNWLECGHDVGVAVANGSFVDESTKEDNVMTVKANCQ